MKRVTHFQERFNGFFMKTFNNIRSQKKKDRLDAMTNIVLDMKYIPLDPYYHDKIFQCGYPRGRERILWVSLLL